MEIGFQTLERLLMTMFSLSESQRGALLGRFKYLQRLGDFGTRPVGSGRARYHLDDVLQLLIIFELIDAGCAPAHALRIAWSNWEGLRTSLAYAWEDAGRQRAGGVPDPLFWAVIPHTLSELGAGGAMLKSAPADRAGELDPVEIYAWQPGKALTGERHAIFVHLPRLLASAVEAFAIVAPARQRSFTTALDKLAAAVVVRDAE